MTKKHRSTVSFWIINKKIIFSRIGEFTWRVSDSWRYPRKHIGWNAGNYFMYQWVPHLMGSVTLVTDRFRLLTITQICSFNLVNNKPKTNLGLLFHCIQKLLIACKVFQNRFSDNFYLTFLNGFSTFCCSHSIFEQFSSNVFS